MNHITQGQSLKLAREAAYPRTANTPMEAQSLIGIDEMHKLCNAAIEWYIAQQAAQEPVAYFDFQEHGFYWAPNVKIGEVPVIRKVAPMPLYSDLYKSEPKVNTSQERVKKNEKSEQVPLTDEQIENEVMHIFAGKKLAFCPTIEDAMRLARVIEAAHGIKESKV